MTLPSELEATSQIGREVRGAIGESLQTTLVGVDVGMNRHKAHADSSAHFYYKTDVEVDSMTLEEVILYEIRCWDGWNNLLGHEGEGRGEVYTHELYIYIYLIFVLCNFLKLYI